MPRRGPAASATWSSWGWESRGQLRRRLGAVAPAAGRMGLSARHLTISTVGLVPGIRRLAAEGLPVNLAVSFHAADDEYATGSCRSTAGIRWPICRRACPRVLRRSGRRLSIEWALIDGVNDRPRTRPSWPRFARPLGAHVNLIPLNRRRGTRSWARHRPVCAGSATS